MQDTMCPKGTVNIIVKRNDTFNAIARRHGITPAELLRLNPRVNPDHLYIGDMLCVPQTDSIHTRNSAIAN